MSDNPDLTERLRRITLSAMLIPAVPLDPEGIDDMVDAIAELTELRADLATARKAVGEAYEECVEIAELAGGYAMASCCKTVAQQIKKAISQHAAEAAKGET